MWSFHWFVTFFAFNPLAWFPWISSRRLFLMNNTKNARIKKKRPNITSPKRHFLNICIRQPLWISFETTFFSHKFQCFPYFYFYFVEGTCDSYGCCPPVVLCRGPSPILHDLKVLSSLNNKAMESVSKEQMTTFHKRFLVCDPSLGLKFLQQIQVHYNMNPNPEMMTEKL
jgi:hypothetical protein